VSSPVSNISYRTEDSNKEKISLGYYGGRFLSLNYLRWV